MAELLVEIYSEEIPSRMQARAAADFKKEVFVEEDSHAAVKRARSQAGPEDLVLVTGSLYLVAEVKKEFLWH